MRVGFGYDAHGFAADRPLVLGGVQIRDTDGLAGHSDADVLAHAIADALLGAAAVGDLGKHFPASRLRPGASSLDILARTALLVAQEGLEIANVDATVVIQQVRIAPHRDEMIDRIARALGVEPDRISIKATTTDHLGFTGRGEGAAATAVCLLQPGKRA